MVAKLIFAITVLIAINLSLIAKPAKQLTYKTKSGHSVSVNGKQIFYDGKIIFTFKYPDEIELDYKKDYFIEDNGSVFLFLFAYGNPNLDRFNVYQIFPDKALLVADSIASPIKDYDGDGNLEFGGRDLTEMHPSRDSMYYIPTQYFEIAKGKILTDKSLIRKMDISINGRYLSKPLDKNGNCCIVVPITKKKRREEKPNRQ
jgi:hypothetical protein